MNRFDYSSPAEVYAAGGKRAGRSSMTYRRFETAAKAIRYSIEELPKTGVRNVALSITHTSATALAHVILED